MAVRDPNRAWEKWGKINPYFGVLSDDAYRVERLTDSVTQEFFKSGEAHIDDAFAVIRAHFDSTFQPDTSIDFGCGTGRLVIPLSRRSARVFGIDVSAGMLDEARKNCAARNIGNVEFVQSVDSLPPEAQRPDFIHSFIVFQHIPVKRGMRILEQLLDRLRPGGYLALHFTVYREITLARRIMGWARHNIPLVHELLQFAMRRPTGEPPMQMNTYDLPRILSLLAKQGASTIVIRQTDHGGHLGALIFARKAER